MVIDSLANFALLKPVDPKHAAGNEVEENEPTRDESVVDLAIEERLLWPSLFEDLQIQMDKAKAVSEQLQLPEGDGSLSQVISNTQTALNLAFLSRERADFPDRKFIDLYSEDSHPQLLTTVLATGEGLHCDENGISQNLENYLRAQYRDLINSGLEIAISMVPAGEVREKVIPLIKQMNDHHDELNEMLRDLAEVEFPVPVLSLQDGKKSIQVPILYSKHFLRDTGGRASFLSYRKLVDGSYVDNQLILVDSVSPLDGTENFVSFVELNSLLIHEIDHAVFSFTHHSELKKVKAEMEEVATGLQRQLETSEMGSQNEVASNIIAELSARLRQLEEQKSQLERKQETASSVVYEGLAKNAERRYMDHQFIGLSQHSASPDFSDGAKVLTTYHTISDQLNLSSAQYAVGDILLSLIAKRISLSEMYCSPHLEDSIVKHPEIIRKIIGYLTQHRNQGVSMVNDLESSPRFSQYSPSSIKFYLRSGLGDGVGPFLFGDEYEKMLSDTVAEVSLLPEEEVDRQISVFASSRPDLVRMLRIRLNSPMEVLQALEISVGKLREKVDHEIDKIIMEPG